MLSSNLRKYVICEYGTAYLADFEVGEDYDNKSPWIICKKYEKTSPWQKMVLHLECASGNKEELHN